LLFISAREQLQSGRGEKGQDYHRFFFHGLVADENPLASSDRWNLFCGSLPKKNASGAPEVFPSSNPPDGQ